MIAGVYFIVNILNGKVYVGSSQNPEARWVGHRKFLRRGDHDNKHLQFSWNRYGEAAFTFEVIERCRLEKRQKREQFYIGHLMQVGVPLYNGSLVVNGNWTVTEEVRRKHSRITSAKYADPVIGPLMKAAISKVHRGKTMSVESRTKIRQTMLSKPPRSKKHCRNLSKARMGHAVSEETREKIRQSLLGRKTGPRKPPSMATRRKISKTLTGRKTGPCPPERAAKISAAKMGRKMSPEFCESVRRGWIGRRRRAKKKK